MRTLTAYLIAPALAITGFRFSKAFRRGETMACRIVFALVSTVQANIAADKLAGI